MSFCKSVSSVPAGTAGTGVVPNLNTYTGKYSPNTPPSTYAISSVGSAGSLTAHQTGHITTSSTTPLSVEVMRINPDCQVVMMEQQSDGQRVKAVLSPEFDMSPTEMCHIVTLLFAISCGANSKPISFIRRHNLERHFKFSQQ